MRSMLELDDGPVEIETVEGGDPVLVFLHEGLGSIDLWRGVPAEIADAAGGLAAVVYARHGYGRSAPAPLPRRVDYMHDEADRVLPELLAELGVERPALIGHSDGASIALAHAAAGHPVAGLVCLAPHVFVEPETIAGIEAARDAFDATDLAGKLGRYHADPVATFRGWNDVWLSGPFREWTIEDRLAAIEVPVLAIQGTDDDYGTFAQLDAIERSVSGPFRRLEVSGAGHSPHLDAHDEVVAAIVEFVRRLPGDRDVNSAS